MAKKFNPFLFICFPFWNKMLKHYHRANNEYCLHPLGKCKTNVGKMAEASEYFGHDTLINFEHFRNKTNQRIEIRGMGNGNYEYKYRQIKKDCNHILWLFRKNTFKNKPNKTDKN